MPINGLYTMREAADSLGLQPESLRDAVRRGVLEVVRLPELPHRNFVTLEEIERYRNEHRGSQGWDTRKSLGYTPNARSKEYHQTYYRRKKGEGAEAADQT